MKKGTKKSVKKERKYTIEDWMDSIEYKIEYDHSHAEDLCQRIGKMRVAIWALTIYNVLFAAGFLLLLYGNQYLVK